MKKTLIALAALASVSAFAQSSVTISGVGDMAIAYNSVADKNTLAAAATINKFGTQFGFNNRIQFGVVEDLGGGNAALITSQLRFNPSSGTNEGTAGARPLFQGESTVGLRSSFGTVKIGRALTAVQAPNGGTIDPWGVATVATLPYAAGFASSYEAGGEGRIGSAVFYTSPNFSGFSVLFSYGFAKGPTGKVHTAFSGNYSNGPINAMLGFERNNVNDSLTNLGANYDFGPAKLWAGYGIVKGGSVADRGATAWTATASSALIGGLSNGVANSGLVANNGTIKSLALGLTAPLGAATLKVGYGRVAGDVIGTVNTNADTKFALGVSYAMSKRTSLYSNLAFITNKKVLDGNPGIAGTTGARKTALDMGIAHFF